MTIEEVRKLIPVQSLATSPPIKPFLPDSTDRAKELPKTPVVRRSPIVLVVAPEVPVEGLLLLLNGIMPMLLTPSRHFHETALEPLSHRPEVDREIPSPASLADMRETKKIESCWLSPARLF